MRILWPHNFDPKVQNAGVFMYLTAQGLKEHGVQVQTEYLGNLRSVRGILKASKHLNEIAKDFDLVHAQYGSACGSAASLVKNTRKVLTLRGSDWNVYSNHLGFYYLHSRFARFLTARSLKKFDLIITVSHRIEQEVNKVVSYKPVICLPSPIDLTAFFPKEKSNIRKKLSNSANNEKWVLFNSYMLHKPTKGYQLAIKAIELAQKKNPNIKLKIAHNIPHAKIPDFVASCDLILCASTSEGWPNAVKEALACNIPFVSTDVSDLAEIAKQEESCRICPPDPNCLADAICEVLSLPYDYNLRRHVQHMSLEETSKRLYDIYKSVLDR